MAIDLSFLEDAPAPAAAPAAAPALTTVAPAATATGAEGLPLQIPLDLIDEDASQPRQEFDAEKLEELAASIKQHGVIQPITVVPNPAAPGRWLIRYGARRLRASKLAGLKEVPAFISESLDEYAQVIENLQRDDLTALEIAAFIQKRIDAGDNKNKIAKRLGKPNTFVSIHLALVDMPPALADAYGAGKFGAARAVYDLRALHEKNPERVEAWLAEQPEVTVRAVDDLAAEIKGKPKKQKAEPAGNAPDGDGREGLENFARAKSGGDGEGGEGGSGDGGTPPKASTEKLPPAPDGAGDGTPTKSKQSDPNAISRPLMIVEFDGRAAAVLLNRRPSTAGLVWIKYEDGGGEEEIDGSQFKFNRLMDGSP